LNLQSIIRGLHEEKKRLDAVIASLEALENEPVVSAEDVPVPKGRGRRYMASDERRAVSQRMRRYWERRRQAPLPAIPEDPEAPAEPPAGNQ
jgi:hypothetical protein